MNPPRNHGAFVLAAGVLAGGASSRMGRPKEGVRLPDGRTMLACVAAALAPLAPGGIVILGDCRGHALAPAWRRLDDDPPGAGPMGGVRALLRSGIATHYLLATCDQPLLTTELLRPLAVAHDRPAILAPPDGDIAPFPCLLPASCAAALDDAFAAGERSPRRWLLGQSPLRLPASEAATRLTRSINTPEELEDLLHPERP